MVVHVQYTVSGNINFQECRVCRRRFGKDHRDTIRCPKFPQKNRKRKTSDSKQTQDKKQTTEYTSTDDRILRPKQDRDYFIPNSIEDDTEDNPEDMQQGYLCTSADPRRIGTDGGETTILNPGELYDTITSQISICNQTVCLTTTQAGFPLIRGYPRDEEEPANGDDTQLGRPVARYLHPVISNFITFIQTDLTYKGEVPDHCNRQS
jgi:hypothetical protein